MLKFPTKAEYYVDISKFPLLRIIYIMLNNLIVIIDKLHFTLFVSHF